MMKNRPICMSFRRLMYQGSTAVNTVPNLQCIVRGSYMADNAVKLKNSKLLLSGQLRKV
jgi:hypothetical protein